MRRFVDFHTHTTVSDGTRSPEEVIRFAEREKLAAIAITDHDSTAGLQRGRTAAEAFDELTFIPGIEVSAQSATGTLHILGLAIDETHASIQQLARHLLDARLERNPKIIAKLQAMGVELDMADVGAVAPVDAADDDRRILGRLHIVEAMRRKRYVKTIGEGFERYVGSGAPAFVDKETLTAAAVIPAIRESGGEAVLAHPVQLNCDNHAQLERIIRDLIRVGLTGIEVYHSDHSPERTRFYLDVARRFDLAVTGGSDFHGTVMSYITLGRPRVPVAALTGQLRKLVDPQAS